MIQAFRALCSNGWLLSAVTGWVVAQLIKVVVRLIRYPHRKINWKIIMFANGGMPSSHTASVAAMLTTIGCTEGLSSPMFGLASLFAVIVVNDALGVRREAGRHARVLNRILKEEQPVESAPPTKKLREHIGHSPLQVLCGALLGIAIGVLFYVWMLRPQGF